MGKNKKGVIMKRNKFSLSHYKLMTVPMGRLVPVSWFEVIPSDTFQQATSVFLRMLELNTPVFHPIRIRLHHWFVPISKIWDDYEDFYTGGDDGTATPTHPYISLSACTSGQLTDYLGLPVGTWGGTFNINALPFRAYQLIYNTKYRDQQIMTEAAIDTTSGADSTTGYGALRYVCWEKDYFTTCRSDETLGDDVTIPLTGTADVVADAAGYPLFDDGTSGLQLFGDGATADMLTNRAVANNRVDWDDPHLEADLSTTGAEITMGDFYTSQALQRFQQLRNVYGARYPELLRQAYGVTGRDRRYSEPVFLGGGRSTVQVSAAQATDGANTGDLYGNASGALRTKRYRRFFDEHGIVMTLMSIVPKAIYTETINRKWLRETKEDYFTKEFQLVGEQIVTNKEAQAMHSSPNDTFGYQERYAEYKSHPSEVAGDFNGNLNTWHLGREYSGDIALNESWLHCSPTTRIFKATTNDNVLVMANNSIQARRQMIKNPTGKAF